MKTRPWVSGPGEILQHGISLLKDDTDSNRRLAMLSIDNAVELIIKTYLGLPKRVTKIDISRKRYQEISESFPQLLDALEEYASDKLIGIELGDIDWYHRLRNQLYHQGNGLTVERQKVDIYAELAVLLYKNLFDVEFEQEKESQTGIIGGFIFSWAKLERILQQLDETIFELHNWHPGTNIVQLRSRRLTHVISRELLTIGFIDTEDLHEIELLRTIRNKVVHGEAETTNISPSTIVRIKSLIDKLNKMRYIINNQLEDLKNANPVFLAPDP